MKLVDEQDCLWEWAQLYAMLRRTTAGIRGGSGCEDDYPLFDEKLLKAWLEDGQAP
jgi:hypothetical protein